MIVLEGEYVDIICQSFIILGYESVSSKEACWDERPKMRRIIYVVRARGMGDLITASGWGKIGEEIGGQWKSHGKYLWNY